ncbi:MAG: hypothetical protein A3D31_09965 [Candidatus Fluviicola riflensis]|nr:MAG: hypothetical protein CHH17_14380 [Candidatus Fluviicola riflensis]OGS77331.1 MAG: hypothetical protein A3D31_09965 [Candidatus Fluviicola riflensis]OGS82627.1 MAG: hypothetical protein A2724_00075 [Fluviicola sp. RIFCSPHIGHO2_01_FULL_43_53]OGS83910.1 MAG: hypothetical protein A3E30_11365 [Fluviicola sp. RIFCSPHIGHO2_12_FULL_43_24]
MKKTTCLQLLRLNAPLFIFAILFVGLSACHRDIKKDKGIIESELGDACPSLSSTEGDEYVVTSSAQLSAILGGSGCTTSTFGVDFSKNTLLGKYVKGKCKMKIYNQVKREDGSKRILFKILANSKGFCDTDYYEWTWVVVPNFPSDYTVHFIVEKR